MSNTWAIVLAVAILGTVALLVGGLIGWLRHKANSSRARLELELGSEPAIRGPEKATYRGTTAAYPKVLGTGLIALTERRLIFRKMVGGGVDVALADITGVSLARTFNRSVVANFTHLVVHTQLGDVAYFVGDTDEWLAAIEDSTIRRR